jgi:NADPH:quinone reductase-like Zn-dependent oxidoreductase
LTGTDSRLPADQVFRSTTYTTFGADGGAFQKYSCFPATRSGIVPNNVSSEEGCILPLGLSTAAGGLFASDTLGLALPQVDAPPKQQVVLVWGAGTSVGIGGCQLALGAGYEVFATASEANKQMVQSIGARYFSHRSDRVVEDIQGALGDRKLSTIFCSVHNEHAKAACVKLAKLSGLDYACGVMPLDTEPLDGVRWGCANSNAIWENGVAEAVFRDYLPRALVEGRFVPLPKIRVIGHGLEFIQEGLDRVMREYMRSGGGARKLVVTL